MSQGVVIPMPQPTVDPAVKENLGQKVSAIMQTYNDMKRDLMAQPDNPTKAQLNALLEQRRAAVEAIFAAHKATLDAVLGAGQAKLSGFGATNELETIQTQLTAEQGKLTALSTYFESYKSAIAAGNAPPALPPELSGSTGISSTTLAIIAAIAAGAYFWWNSKQ